MTTAVSGGQTTEHVLYPGHIGQRLCSTRAQKSVMKMSIIHVLVFVISWTPYTVMATW